MSESMHLQNKKLLLTFQTSNCVHFANELCIGTSFVFQKQGIKIYVA